MKRAFFLVMVIVLASSAFGREINCAVENCDSMMSYWKMNEGSGNLADSSGNGYTATATSLTYSQTGMEGGAIRWNGGSSKAVTASNLPLGGNMSVSVWIKPYSTASIQPLFTQGGYTSVESGGGGWYIRTSGGAPVKYQFVVSDTAGGYLQVLSSTAVSTSGWVNIVVTIDGANQTRMYVNGVLESNDNASVLLNPTRVAPLKIGVGCWNSGECDWMNADYDEVSVWNRSLSAAEVKQMYDNVVIKFVPEFGTWALILSLTVVVGAVLVRRQK